MAKVQELQHLSLATTYEVDDSFDSDKFIKMRLRVCHDGQNPNKSSFVVDDMERAKDSIKNIPILANVIVDENGDVQFGGHDMILEDSKVNEGEVKLIYKETPIGLVPETCNHEIKEFNNKNYVYVDCYVWKGYSNYSEDIINRDKDIKLSMEILVDAYSYNAKEKTYNITDYRYQGITFLNKNYGTGMENALATTGTFEEDDSKNKFIVMMEELKDTLATYDINIKEEGGSTVNEEIKALLEQYNLTADQLAFSIEEMTVEEVESKLKEIYNKEEDQEEGSNSEPEKFVKSFELSHGEIRYALYKLLSPVESEDNEWYFIDQVYDDRFEYVNWEGTKIFRQIYKKDGDVVSFDGDRIELFQERLTADEKEELDKIRSNYTILEQEISGLKQFKEEALAIQRKEAEDTLFEQFAELDGIAEFEILKSNSTNYELDSLEKECYVILGKKNAKFSTNKPSKTSRVKVGFTKVENNDVGEFDQLFDKYLKNKEEI